MTTNWMAMVIRSALYWLCRGMRRMGSVSRSVDLCCFTVNFDATCCNDLAVG